MPLLPNASIRCLSMLSMLQSLTFHCVKQHEEENGPCFTGFPDLVLKLKGLQELALASIGAVYACIGNAAYA